MSCGDACADFSECQNAGPIAKLRQRLQKGIAWAAALVSPGATSPRTAADEDASKPEPEPEEEPEEPKTIAVAKRRRVSEDSEDGDKKKRKLSGSDSNNNNNNNNDERKPERMAEAESDGEEKHGEHGEGDEEREEEHEDFEAEIENLMREAKEKGQRGKKRTSGTMYGSDSLDEDEGGAGDGDSVRHHKQQTKQKSSKLHKKVKLEDQTSTTPRGARDEKEADEKELKKKKEEERQRRAEERMKRREADRLRREEEIIQKRVMMLATTTGEQHARLAADDLDGMDDDLAGQSGAEEFDELSTSTMANSGDGSGGEEGVRSTPTKGGRGRRKSGGKKSQAIKREEEEEELEGMELVYGRDNLEKLNTKVLILQSKMRGLPTQVHTRHHRQRHKMIPTAHGTRYVRRT